jgi:hypothetical protein
MRKLVLLFLMLVTGLASFAQTSIYSSPVTTGTVGSLYTSPITAVTNTNNPITFSVVNTLPAFLSFSSSGQSAGLRIGGSTPEVGAVASDANGNFYAVQNPANFNNIYKITPDGTTIVWAQKPSGFTTYGGALVQGNYLYVTLYSSGQGNGGLVKYDITQASPVAIPVIATGYDFLSMVYKDGFIYAADYVAKKIFKINISDNTITALVTLPYGPYGVGFNKAGELYIAYYLDKKIGKYSPGTGVLTITSLALEARPSDVKIDDQDNMYISLYGYITQL